MYNIGCRECKYHNVYDRHKDGWESTCKRLDHKHYQFVKPIFVDYCCASAICRDFQPSAIHVYMRRLWHDRYIRFFTPKENATVRLVIDGDQSVHYYVRHIDFFNNEFINPDGSLKWIYKMYEKKTRYSSFGHILVLEYPDGRFRANGRSEFFNSLDELLKSEKEIYLECKEHEQKEWDEHRKQVEYINNKAGT